MSTKINKIIHWIIDQELESIDTYPELAAPIAKEFELDLGITEGIINTVIEWECDNTIIDSLEETLINKFPLV